MALAGLLISGNPAAAQNEPSAPRRQNIQQRVDRMSEELNLTDEQKPKFKALLESEAKAMQELRRDTNNVTREQRQAKVREIRDENQKKMKALLTPEQFEKLQKQRDQLREKGRKKAAQASDDKSSDKTTK
jgi:Spy/CpxP family protein refolding chaperone